MKILLGNNTLSLLAGSETYTYTLALELKKLGHEVTAFSPQLGLIAAKLSAAGIDCVDSLGGGNTVSPYSIVLEENKGNFDVIICNHYEITKYLRDRFPDTPIIATVHGVLHKGENGEIWPEHPYLGGRVDQFVSVSEEIQSKLKNDYDLDSVIIRNFIDLDRFKKAKKLPEKPRGILVNSNYWGVESEINHIIKQVATTLGCPFMGIGMNFQPTAEVEAVLDQVDIVFGMGRSVLEGAAMGKFAVCHGRWGTGGIFTPESMETLKMTNFSGRPYIPGETLPMNQLMSAEDIIAGYNKHYNQKNVDAVYNIIKKEHNATVAAKKYLELAEQLLKR